MGTSTRDKMLRTLIHQKVRLDDSLLPVCSHFFTPSHKFSSLPHHSMARCTFLRAIKCENLPNHFSHHPYLRHPLRGEVTFLGQNNFSTSKCSLSDDRKKSENPGIVKRFKAMIKDYWYVLVPVHVATSIVWLGGFYLMLKAGVDIVGFLEYVGTSQRILDYMSSSEAGYYALSYACYKLATPFRYTVTVGGTTFTIAKLKDTGYLKSTTEVAEKIKDAKEDMKDKYGERIEDFKERAEGHKDKIKEEWENSWERFAKRKK